MATGVPRAARLSGGRPVRPSHTSATIPVLSLSHPEQLIGSRSEAPATRSAFRAGLIDAIPLAVPGIPFGFILGVAVAEAPIHALVGWAGSWIILGGAAQLTMTSLLTDGATALAAVAAALFVNARHVMYSMSMAAPFRAQPRWFRLAGPYFLLDQVFAVADIQRDRDPGYFRRYYLGASLTMAGPWVVWVALGIVVGAQVPSEWNLGFAVPVLFAGLMILGVRNLAGATAAVIGFTVSAALGSLPNRSGMLIGAILGVVVSAFVPNADTP